MPTPDSNSQAAPQAPKRQSSSLWIEVSIAIVVAIIFGHFSPAYAVAMKPFATPHISA